MRIYLTGFMGSGKTTIGRLLSQKLSRPFYDLDHEIESNTGKSVAQIFEESGEDEFRRIETELLQGTEANDAVISTGGGCFPQNQEWMLQRGLVIYLDVPFETLVKRIGADPSRPLWKNAEQLYKERKRHYEGADWTVDATGTPDEVVDEIIRRGVDRYKKS